MSVKILFFGMIAEKTKCSTTSIDNVSTIQEVKENVFSLYPELKTMNFVCAKNLNMATDNTSVVDGDSIAFLPPFAGG